METMNTTRRTAVFGRPNLSEGALEFYKRLNACPSVFCRGLPGSVRDRAYLFLTSYFGAGLIDPDFFKAYFPPSWTFVYHLIDKSPDPSAPNLLQNVLRAHAAALLLHSIDDHLADGDLDPGHIEVLVRSEIWRNMIESLSILGGDIGTPARDAVSENLSLYYYSITRDDEPRNLEHYLDNFRGEMATWTTVPELISITYRDNGVRSGIRAAYESFGIAWRLLDDINDADEDIASSKTTSVTLAPGTAAAAQDGQTGLREADILLIKRIAAELKYAEEITEALGFHELSMELNNMRMGLK